MNALIRKLTDLAWSRRAKPGGSAAADDRIRRIAIHSSRGAHLAAIVGELRRRKLPRGKTVTGYANRQEHTSE